MGCQPTIHVNPSLKRQKQFGEAIAAGFRRHGLRPTVTADPGKAGDFHVVIGPWFALDRWRMENTLYVDRAYWGDPCSVSVHWLGQGKKIRSKGNPHREHPELQPMKSGDRQVYLCDYGQEPIGNYHVVRYHPAHKPSRYTLAECLSMNDIAIGRRTTALVDAHIQGLRVETDDPESPVWGITDRLQWVIDLAWHNWSHDEIARGEMWSHIRSQ